MKRQLINAHNQGIMREAFTAIVPNRARKPHYKRSHFALRILRLLISKKKDS